MNYFEVSQLGSLLLAPLLKGDVTHETIFNDNSFNANVACVHKRHCAFNTSFSRT